MLSRKPSILLCTHGSSALGGSTVGSSTSLISGEGTRQSCRCRIRRRAYATIYGDEHSSNHENNAQQEQHVWPQPPKGQQHPTPYQIFSMTNTRATYSKTRFYELVKLYHPDRNNGSLTSVTHAVKTERYRLIVAAHTILSDPSRRDAYDRFGAGWNGKGEIGQRGPEYDRPGQGQPGPFTSRWQRNSDPIWQNATWEDWERFWAKKARENGEEGNPAREAARPQYLSNSYFVALVGVLALIGSTANYTRAKDSGAYVVARRDMVHDQTAKDLRRVKQEATGGRDQRIQWFLRNREAALGEPGSDLETIREEKVDRLLPEREVCRSDEINGKDS